MKSHQKNPIQHRICHWILNCAGLLAFSPLLLTQASGTIIQTNYGTGDGSIPGGTFSPTDNLLATTHASASYSGTFYRQDSGYTVDISRLTDGDLGSAGTAGLGGDGHFTVMPNVATIEYDFDQGYDISSIRTYASWDLGRSGQGYTVMYATSAAPTSFLTLYTISQYNNPTSIFPLVDSYDPDTDQDIQVPDTSVSSTLVTLTSSSDFLATDVVALRFIFNGYQNSGTAFREIQVSTVPEVNAVGLLSTSAMLLGFGYRRRTAR